MSRFVQILVVDDDPQILRTIRAALLAEGYQVRTASDGESALRAMKDWNPDVVVTDLVMPNMDGVDLCRHLRSRSQVPILVLSAKGEDRIKTEAFNAGADQYATKPLSIDELQARINAILRRTAVAIVDEKSSKIEEGDFLINLWTRQVWVRGVKVRLTPKEYDLLAYFANRPSRVILREALLNGVWGPDSAEEPECLRVLIGQLRKKIEIDPTLPQYILTEPRIGYRFEPVANPETM
jgi:two-component system KDP operon response regulator KdpE